MSEDELKIDFVFFLLKMYQNISPVQTNLLQQ